MRILICPDSFKGSLTATKAAAAMAKGARKGAPDCEIVTIPLADGGEGTVDAFLRARPGRRAARAVLDPLGRPIKAAFAFFDGPAAWAVVECAAASGLTLLAERERDPRRTTSFGTGQLIAAAIRLGAQSVVIGLGGSATNDGGAGALQALGVRFLHNEMQLIVPLTGADLSRIDRIDRSAVAGLPVAFTLATDVDNPMVGERGGSMIYGPQKGGSPAVCRELDAAMAGYERVLARATGVAVAERPGAGAAGGLGGGLMAVLGASVAGGIDVVLDAAGFDAKAARADLILTGEGSVDSQTLRGKAVMGVVRRARLAGWAPVIAIGGRVEAEAVPRLLEAGLRAAVAASPDDMPVEEAMRRAAELVTTAAESAVSDFADTVLPG